MLSITRDEHEFWGTMGRSFSLLPARIAEKWLINAFRRELGLLMLKLVIETRHEGGRGKLHEGPLQFGNHIRKSIEGPQKKYGGNHLQNKDI